MEGGCLPLKHTFLILSISKPMSAPIVAWKHLTALKTVSCIKLGTPKQIDRGTIVPMLYSPSDTVSHSCPIFQTPRLRTPFGVSKYSSDSAEKITFAFKDLTNSEESTFLTILKEMDTKFCDTLFEKQTEWKIKSVPVSATTFKEIVYRPIVSEDANGKYLPKFSAKLHPDADAFSCACLGDEEAVDIRGPAMKGEAISLIEFSYVFISKDGTCYPVFKLRRAMVYPNTNVEKQKLTFSFPELEDEEVSKKQKVNEENKENIPPVKGVVVPTRFDV